MKFSQPYSYINTKGLTPFVAMKPELARLVLVHGLIWCAVLLLTGCQDNVTSDLEQFVASAYQDKKPKIDALPEMAPYYRFTYTASDEPDPFSIGKINFDQGGGGGGSNSELAPDNNRRKEALEAYPLDALRLVGTLEQGNTPYVIVQSTDGTAHRAGVGNYIGQNDGRIIKIFPLEQRVLLTELVSDASGRWVSREVEITIDE